MRNRALNKNRSKGQELDNKKVAELIDFLPYLKEIKSTKVTKWLGGEKRADGSFDWPFPDYPVKVEEFFRVAAQPWWVACDYQAAKPRELLESRLKSADMNQAKSVLTFCVRGERFCDGFWEELIESGALIPVLERVRQLWQERMSG